MRTTDKTLQRKTIELTPEETRKAVIYYLEEAEFDYTKVNDDGSRETNNHNCRISTGSDTTVVFNDKGAATVITHYP